MPETIISVPGTYSGVTYTGYVTVTAADVTLDGCTINGDNPANTLLTGFTRTKVLNCDLNGSSGGQHRGIRTDAAGIVVFNSRIKNIWASDDAQAIAAWDGCLDLQVQSCELEASGEVVLFGGATMTVPENQPRNILIDGCFLTRKIEWRGDPLITNKNIFELKNCKDLIMSNSTLQYSWEDGQQGQAIVLNVRQDPFPYSSIENITIFNNQIRNVGSGINILGHDDSTDLPCGSLRNVRFEGNTFTDINPATWGGNGRQIEINRGSDNLTFLANRFQGPNANLNSFMSFSGPTYLNNGLIVERNEAESGLYGIVGDGAPSLGIATLQMYAPGYVWKCNTIHGRDINTYVVWPPGTM